MSASSNLRLQKQTNTEVVYVEYGAAIAIPAEQAARINQFLHHRLNVKGMAGVVDPLLYRQRK